MSYDGPVRAGAAAAVAVYVDGDNLGHDQADAILAQAALAGRITLRRVYGDLTKCQDWARDPRFIAQHAGGEAGRNSADMRLVIDALEHAMAGRARTVVIASNDRDFAPLAARLVELGLQVVGIGRPHAARAFQAACAQFVHLAPEPAPPKPAPRTAAMEDLDRRIAETISAHGTDGQLLLALLGSKLGNARALGIGSWSRFLKKRPDRYTIRRSGTETRILLNSR